MCLFSSLLSVDDGRPVESNRLVRGAQVLTPRQVGRRRATCRCGARVGARAWPRTRVLPRVSASWNGGRSLSEEQIRARRRLDIDTQ